MTRLRIPCHLWAEQPLVQHTPSIPGTALLCRLCDMTRPAGRPSRVLVCPTMWDRGVASEALMSAYHPSKYRRRTTQPGTGIGSIMADTISSRVTLLPLTNYACARLEFGLQGRACSEVGGQPHHIPGSSADPAAALGALWTSHSDNLPAQDPVTTAASLGPTHQETLSMRQADRHVVATIGTPSLA